jgi:hypothetical protein
MLTHKLMLTSPPPFQKRLAALSVCLNLLCRYDPDLVVSVHPLMQHINCHVLRERAKRQGRARPTPFATVVTDFTTCHNAWFCKVCCVHATGASALDRVACHSGNP